MAAFKDPTVGVIAYVPAATVGDGVTVKSALPVTTAAVSPFTHPLIVTVQGDGVTWHEKAVPS